MDYSNISKENSFLRRMLLESNIFHRIYFYFLAFENIPCQQDEGQQHVFGFSEIQIVMGVYY